MFFFEENDNFYDIISGNGIIMKISTIEKANHGKSSFVFFVKTLSEEYVFKFPRTYFQYSQLQYEAEASSFLEKVLNCNVPQIIIKKDKKGRAYAVYRMIKGTNMSDVLLNTNEIKNLCFHLSNNLKRIHALSPEQVPFQLQTKKDSLIKFAADFDYLPKFELIEDLFEEKSVIHGDFHRSNILIDDRCNLCGILDFSTLSIGSVYFDVGHMMFSMNREFNKIFLDEYQKSIGEELDHSKIDRVIMFLDDMINKHYLPYIKGRK